MGIFDHVRCNYEDLLGAGEADNIELSRKITLYMICFLVLILLLVLSHYLFTTCVRIRRQSRRRAAIELLSLAMQLHHSEPTTSGLDPDLIEALPVFVVEPKPQEDHGVDLMEHCAVCLSGFEEKEMVKLIPNCNHFFHVDCIDSWLALQPTCPLCRAWVQPRLEPEHREGPISMVVLPVLDHSEGTSEGGVGEARIIDGEGSGSRLSSFRSVLIHDDVHEDLERC